MIIAVDFDGTIVEHRYPAIGPPAPHALKWLRKFHREGARLVLWTCRHDRPGAPELSEARNWLDARGVVLHGCNTHRWRHADGPKINAHVFIDDHGFGVPLRIRKDSRSFVDWRIVGPAVFEKLMLWKRMHGSARY